MLSKEEKKDIIKELKEELNNNDIIIQKVRDISLPFYAHKGDAGADVRSAIDIDIAPGETVLIPLGFKMDIPISYEVEVRPRSGISLKTPLRVANAPGTVDSGYKDEICVIMTNTSTTNDGIFTLTDKGNKNGVYHISKGDRVAQILLMHYSTMNFVEGVVGTTNDRGGGMGHSGTK